ncbi:unnamed protein product [Cochlearia groenlandica]
MVAGDEWTKSAMRDGEVVVEILLSLKEAKVTHHHHHHHLLLRANPTVASSLRWGIRQPRSRSPRKEAESAKNSRCSPSTPLSWSGGYGASSSSPSAYIDGYEATSSRISESCAVGSRSKVVVTTDLDSDVKNELFDCVVIKQDTASKTMEKKKLKLNTYGSSSISYGNFLLPDLNMMPCDETGDH